MKKTICLVVLFLTFGLSAQNSIETTFEEWMKFHMSDGNIGTPSKVFDEVINLSQEVELMKQENVLEEYFLGMTRL